MSGKETEMQKKRNTILDVLESIEMIERVGGKPTVKNVGRVAGSSFYRTKTLLLDAKANGLVNSYKRSYRVNAVQNIWGLTPNGKRIVQAFVLAYKSQGWIDDPQRDEKLISKMLVG